jgi:hypothetical protein
MNDQLEMSYTKLQSLKQQNELLKAQEAQTKNSVSRIYYSLFVVNKQAEVGGDN